ncbi:MAG: DNA polymerase III subunit epsilon [Rhodospirillales bacterium]|nr:DNA polymerase III subunit epsilon [Rhodospirillales bacterium]MSP80608.1 DNA polymerase III subunit epsilon [Rhodospirillales bacterium]
MREIVLDTETTGLDPRGGDRIVEIGCVELINHVPTGQTFQRYVNPERDVPEAAVAVHGLSREFLAAHPVFAAIAGDLVAFIEDSPLIIHNAAFDLGFVNAEFARIERAPLDASRATDTVQLARRKIPPGASASLDALCARFGIDASERAVHGALKDAMLLAEVYLELIGGRQPGLTFAAVRAGSGAGSANAALVRAARPHAPTDAEAEAHAAFVAKLKDPVWKA